MLEAARKEVEAANGLNRQLSNVKPDMAEEVGVCRGEAAGLFLAQGGGAGGAHHTIERAEKQGWGW